jgi:CheY-like chemotaxis protein
MDKLQKILLIDDNKVDNFFHERVIRKFDKNITVTSMLSGEEAIDYLSGLQSSELPDLIFLDINMPGMNGWEFLQEYSKFEIGHKSCVIVVMLSTSEDPEDKERALEQGIASDYRSKPLTEQMLTDICDRFICLSINK